MAAKTKVDPEDIDVAAIFTEEEIEELDDRFDPCTHGRKLRCDECSSRDYQEGNKHGFESGFNWVIKEIEARAAAAFLKKKDSAEDLRDMIDEIKEKAVKEKLWAKPK